MTAELACPPIVIAAPSGTGKTTIARSLVDRFDRFVFSVSVTTRPRRETERDGIDYHFVSGDEFARMRNQGELIEWAEVHGYEYGTQRSAIDRAAGAGAHAVLDIDVQGAAQIRELVPEAILIFILPPSGTALLSRLRGRGTESRDVLVRRLMGSRGELHRAGEFDHVVVNDHVERAVQEVVAIVDGEAVRVEGIADLDMEVSRLQAEIDEVLESGVSSDLPGGAEPG